MTVTFCGHSEVSQEKTVRQWLRSTVQNVIDEGADMFLLGGYGAFDRMAAAVVWELKEAQPEIQSILVLPYLDRKADTTGYDGTTYPPLESVPKRYAISCRNKWMIEQADVVIAYVTHGWGGAAITLRYAVQKKKTIFQFRGDQI